MRRLVLVAIFSLYPWPALLAASSEAPPTVEEYLTRIQTTGPLAIVSYCVAEVPGLKGQLEDQYQQFVVKVTSAVQPLRERFGSALSQPVPSGAEQFHSLSDQMLQAVKKYPAESYCRWLLASMKTTSAESLRSRIEAAYSRYEELAAEKEREASQ